MIACCSYEYFHGDNGAGLGASHQTGWTGIIARMMHLFAAAKPSDTLRSGGSSYAEAITKLHGEQSADAANSLPKEKIISRGA